MNIKIGDIVESISETHSFKEDRLYAINTSDVLDGRLFEVPLSKTTDLKGQFKKTIKQGDLLFSEIRPANRRFARVEIEDTHLHVVSTKLMVLRKYNDEVDADYFYYYITNQDFLNILQNRAENRIGSFPQITFDLLCEYSIPAPSLQEQKQIVKLISLLDRKIALNRKANELLESMAKQLYGYWFVQFDFPNEEGKPYKSSGGKMVYNEKLKRDIPEEWEVGNLFEVSNLLTGGTPSKAVDDYWQGGTIPFFGPTDCDGSTFQFTTEYRITESGVSHSAAKVMNENCVIITARGSIGKYVITGIPMAMNQSCFAFEAKDGNYVHLYFLVGQLIQHLLVKGSGSTFKSIVGIDIENSILSLGEPNVRKAFERIVCPMFEKMKSNTQETLRLTSLRDYLLPLLMNGQAKVS